MDFNADDLERAVVQFYQSNSIAQAEAHQYLTSAKCSPQAWAFVWELLQPNKSSEVQFYGATTLHTKVEKSLHELTPEEVVQLRDRLLTSVVTYSSGPKIVLNRLCVSLSAYLLRTCPEAWKDAITEIIHTFTPDRIPNVPVNRVIWVLLEILSLIPEEFSCMHFTSHQKGLLRHELEKNAGQVVSLLESILSSHNDEDVILQGTKCAASWATFGVLPTQSQNLITVLVSHIFNYHKVNAGICEKSLEAVSAISVHPHTFKYPVYLLEMLAKILPLREIIAREHLSPNGTDKDMIRNVYSVLISFGETHSQLLLEWLKVGGTSREHVMALVTALLHCSGAPGSYPVDEAHSRLAFGFWYILQDQMMACKDSSDSELCMSLLVPIYRELVNVLMCKAQLPAQGVTMSRDDAESFRCYRQDIGDTMMYCYSILRKTTLSLIQAKLEIVNSEEMTWQQIEACLFSLCSIAENVDLEEITYLPTLFQYIRLLPFDRLNPKVLSTALDTVGAYAEWIASNYNTLEHVLPLIPLGLNVPEAAPSATMALKDLTRDYISVMKPYSTIILDACQKTLHSGRLKMNDNVRLMYSVGRLLTTLPAESLYPSMDVIVSPYFTQLETRSSHQPSEENKAHISVCLKMLGTVMAALDTRLEGQAHSPHPALAILHKLLPVLKLTATVYNQDNLIMQSIYSLLKHAVTTLMDDSEPIVEDVLDLIVSSYRICPVPTALNLSKQLCILFGKEGKYAVVMPNLIGELCDVTMATALSSDPSENTDLLSEFFVFIGQLVKKTPQLLSFYSFNNDAVLIIQCACMCLGVAELLTVKAAAAFLVSFILHSREIPMLSNIVNLCGEQLVQKIIALIGGEASRSNVEPLADILLALNKKYCDNHARWLNESVCESLCQRATAEERESFVRLVLRERTNRRKLQEHVQEFSLICRGIICRDIVTTAHSSF